TWVSTPPSAGPTAAPSVPAVVQTARPRSADPVSAERSASEPARRSAAPSPWTQRATISAGRLHEAAAATEARQNTASPTRVTFPTSNRRSTGTRANAATETTRLDEVITHETPTIGVPNAR